MNPARTLLAGLSAGLAAGLLLVTDLPALTPPTTESSWAWRDAAGRLLLHSTDRGDRLPDFSTCGWRGGLTPPASADRLVPADRILTVAPVDGDDTAALQTAIDTVSAFPLLADGWRGCLQLVPGEYQIAGQLTITASGVILRGTPDTRLHATGTDPRALLRVGLASGGWREVRDTRTAITDDYVPVGAAALNVASAAAFSVGDRVIVYRPATAAWIAFLGLDRIPPRSDGGDVTQWTPGGSYDQHYERTLTRIEGDRLFLDSPLPNNLDAAHTAGAVYRFTFPDRITHIAIEDLHGVSDYDASLVDDAGRAIDEAHSWVFIEMDRVENGWLQRIGGHHFSHATVVLREYTRNITVRDAASHAPVSKVTGRRRYAFVSDGQFNLFEDIRSEFGRHDLVNNSQSRGPNVFLHARIENCFSEVGPHQRWSTGTLYEDVHVSGSGGVLAAYNRGGAGTGHGFSGAQMVFWNCTAPRFTVENPPGAHNWIVGGVGRIVNPKDFLDTPLAHIDRHGGPVPFGLHEAQRAQRLAASSASYPFFEYTATADVAGGVALRHALAAGESVRAARLTLAFARPPATDATLKLDGRPLALDAFYAADGASTFTAWLPDSALPALADGQLDLAPGPGSPLVWARLEFQLD